MTTDFAPTSQSTPVPRSRAGLLPPGWMSPGQRRLAWVALLAVSLLASFQGLELAVAAFRDGTGGDWLDLGVHAVVLAVLPLLLAAAAGDVLRRRGKALRRGHIDGGTGLYNRAGMFERGNAMLAACRRDKRVMAVAVFDFSDMLEVREIYGVRIYRQAMVRVVRKMRAVAGKRGLTVRTGSSQFTMLLPGVSHERALRTIGRKLGSPARIEMEAGRNEIMLVPELMVDVACQDTESIEELYGDICAELALIRKNESRRHHTIKLERERHSRPMGRHGRTGSRRVATAVMAAQTVRSPLAMS